METILFGKHREKMEVQVHLVITCPRGKMNIYKTTIVLKTIKRTILVFR